MSGSKARFSWKSSGEQGWHSVGLQKLGKRIYSCRYSVLSSSEMYEFRDSTREIFVGILVRSLQVLRKSLIGCIPMILGIKCYIMVADEAFEFGLEVYLPHINNLFDDIIIPIDNLLMSLESWWDSWKVNQKEYSKAIS